MQKSRALLLRGRQQLASAVRQSSLAPFSWCKDSCLRVCVCMYVYVAPIPRAVCAVVLAACFPRCFSAGSAAVQQYACRKEPMDGLWSVGAEETDQPGSKTWMAGGVVGQSRGEGACDGTGRCMGRRRCVVGSIGVVRQRMPIMTRQQP